MLTTCTYIDEQYSAMVKKWKYIFKNKLSKGKRKGQWKPAFEI